MMTDKHLPRDTGRIVAHPRSRGIEDLPQPGDETWGCVDWFIYDHDAGPSLRKDSSRHPLQGRISAVTQQ